jgi:ribosomal protein S27AE
MTGEENPDPLGEYVKVCPYCGEIFTAGHMNRQYCYEKNGFKDYCKNRYKRFSKQRDIEAINNYDPNVLINAVILKRLLGLNKTKIIDQVSLFKVNYDFDAYDFETPIFRDDFYSVIVENFVLEIASVDRIGNFYKIKNLDYFNVK